MLAVISKLRYAQDVVFNHVACRRKLLLKVRARRRLQRCGNTAVILELHHRIDDDANGDVVQIKAKRFGEGQNSFLNWSRRLLQFKIGMTGGERRGQCMAYPNQRLLYDKITHQGE